MQTEMMKTLFISTWCCYTFVDSQHGVVQEELQISYLIMKFLIVNYLKLDPSSTNLAFEHVQHVTSPIAILQYWWKCIIFM